MRAHRTTLIGLGLLAAGAAHADTWNVYLPRGPYSDPPPVFSTNTWTFVETVNDTDSLTGDTGEACQDEVMTLHYRYWNAGDKDASRRAFQIMCVSQSSGNVMRDLRRHEDVHFQTPGVIRSLHCVCVTPSLRW